MVAILKPYCLSHQKPKTSSRQQHEFAKREPQEPPYSTWAGEPGKISAPSSRRRVFSLDSPLYRTRLPVRWAIVQKWTAFACNKLYHLRPDRESQRLSGFHWAFLLALRGA